MLMPSILGKGLFDDWMDFSFPEIERTLYGKNAKNMMKTDIRETDSGYEVSVDLPGFAREDVKLQLENGYLTINAVKSGNREDSDKKGKYIRQERFGGSLSRSFYVGEELTEEDIRARYENGILVMDVPKSETKKADGPRYIAIEG